MKNTQYYKQYSKRNIPFFTRTLVLTRDIKLMMLNRVVFYSIGTIL